MDIFEQFLSINPGEQFVVIKGESLTRTDAVLGLRRAHDHLVNLRAQEQRHSPLHCRAVLQDFREKQTSYEQLKEKLKMDKARITELLRDNMDFITVLLWQPVAS